MEEGVKMEEKKVPRGDRVLFLFIFLLLLGLHLSIVLSQRIFPFIDLPNHLAVATIFRHLGEATNRFAEYYSIRFGPKPNIIHLVFCSLPLFPTVEAANRAYYALYVLLLPLSTLLITVRLGGSRWFALPAFLLLYNLNVGWGFTEYTLSIPLVLLLVYVLIWLVDRGGAAPRLAAALMLVLIFFAHGQAILFAFCVYFSTFLIHHRRRLRRLALDALPALPALVLFFNWAAHIPTTKQSTGGFLLNYYGGEFLTTIPRRFGRLPVVDNYFLFDGVPGILAALSFSAVIILPVLYGLRRRRTDLPALWDEEKFAPLLALLASSLGCFFLLPDRIPRQWCINERIAVYVLIALALLAGLIYRRGIGRAAALGLALICLVHFALWADYFRGFDRENRGFNAEFLPRPAEDARLGGLILAPFFRGNPIYIHFPAYQTVWNRGIASATFPDFRFGVVKRNIGAAKLPPYHGLDWAGIQLRRYDGRYGELEYLLLRGKMQVTVAGRLPQFQELRSAGEWTLYRNTRRRRR